MKTRLLILAVGVFGVLAFIFAGCSARASAPRAGRANGELYPPQPSRRKTPQAVKPINLTHLALVILACIAGSACSVITPSLPHSTPAALPAIPVARNHDAIDLFTGYHCPARHHYETPNTSLAP